jgi:hypothetical protein
MIPQILESHSGKRQFECICVNPHIVRHPESRPVNVPRPENRKYCDIVVILIQRFYCCKILNFTRKMNVVLFTKKIHKAIADEMITKTQMMVENNALLMFHVSLCIH